MKETAEGAPARGRSARRAGFMLIEVLAALVVTSAFVAVVLPYAGRLASHWWVGETTVEAADGWMQTIARMSDDLTQALPYGLGPDGKPAVAFRAGTDSMTFVRPALGGGESLDAVTYEIRATSGGSALVRRNRPFDPAAFTRDGGGAATVLIDGAFRFRLVEVARDGTRHRDWTQAEGMPAAVELSVLAIHAGTPIPVAPVLLPIAARAPAVSKPGADASR